MAGISNRPNRSGKTLQAVIDIVSEGSMHSYVWISKNYSQADLIDDLNSIMVEKVKIHVHDENRLNRMTPDNKSRAMRQMLDRMTALQTDVDDMSLEPSIG